VGRLLTAHQHNEPFSPLDNTDRCEVLIRCGETRWCIYRL